MIKEKLGVYPRCIYITTIAEEFESHSKNKYKVTNNWGCCDEYNPPHDDDYDKGVIIYIDGSCPPYYELPRTIVHEAFHAVNRIFADLGVDYTLDNDEHAAYLLDFIVGRLHELVAECKRKRQKPIEKIEQDDKEEIAEINRGKLASRKERGVIDGNGDNR